MSKNISTLVPRSIFLVSISLISLYFHLPPFLALLPLPTKLLNWNVDDFEFFNYDYRTWDSSNYLFKFVKQRIRYEVLHNNNHSRTNAQYVIGEAVTRFNGVYLYTEKN